MIFYIVILLCLVLVASLVIFFRNAYKYVVCDGVTSMNADIVNLCIRLSGIFSSLSLIALILIWIFN